jgi:hypothetical protein
MFVLIQQFRFTTWGGCNDKQMDIDPYWRVAFAGVASGGSSSM